jgi:hypothetical protein
MCNNKYSFKLLQSSLQDYENIPIDVFGMAMLRGMGWQPGKGIGKNEKYGNIFFERNDHIIF